MLENLNHLEWTGALYHRLGVLGHFDAYTVWDVVQDATTTLSRIHAVIELFKLIVQLFMPHSRLCFLYQCWLHAVTVHGDLRPCAHGLR